MTRERTHSPKRGNRIRMDQTQFCKTITSDMDLLFLFLNIISTHADEVAKSLKKKSQKIHSSV